MEVSDQISSDEVAELEQLVLFLESRLQGLRIDGPRVSGSVGEGGFIVGESE